MKGTGTKLKLVAAGLLSAAVFGLSACGGSDDDPGTSPNQESADVQAIKAIGVELKSAYSKGDAAAACALLSPKDLKTQFDGKADCAKRVAVLIKAGKAKPDVNFTSVEVDGDKATAKTGKQGTGRTTYAFVRVGGNWYIKLTGAGSS